MSALLRPSPTQLFAALLAIPLLAAASPARGEDDLPVDPALFQALEWRLIGPFRGGRVTAVTGVRREPLTFYFGATGGGVWKTEDGGTRWRNVTDGHVATGSVGAVAVAESDPNVVYAGMGEAQIRGVMSSHGDGVYRSTDGGASWTHLGLAKTRQISRIRVHPEDPDRVYVAAQGNPWTPSRERGVYRSGDGGRTWLRVLYVDDLSGASDLAMDPSNPRVLYAAVWQHQRRPWKIESGGPGSGLYKTTDGGDSWEKLEGGLPELLGKVGVAVAADPRRVWAMVEAEEGGLFRSDDGGEKWLRVNRERKLRARAWYYTKVIADPRDPDTVWVANAPLLRSVDGGRTFTEVETPHGDHHDLWIHPDDPGRLVGGNDGGANVSTNGGATWSTQANQPTGQFYRVATDRLFPYRVYGGQQDNTTVAISSRGRGRGIGRADWFPVGGCESAHVAFDPDDPRRIYAGCYQGLISEYDVETRRRRSIMAYPGLGLGAEPRELRYRFNWNAPIVVSPHDPKVIYHAANVVLRSRDRGTTWEVVSPDLTRDEVEKQGPGGGPITNEAAGGETYNTLLSLVESPHEAGTLWAGSDDGRVHLTRDSGETWSDVTPGGVVGTPSLGEAQVNSIEVSPHELATVWLAVHRYKSGDFTPEVWKSEDYGVTWRRLVEGLGEEAFVRVVREDPARQGLLYAGTETGLYVSFDGGERWQPFQRNLPVVPVTDLAIRDHDLVAATQGRAFWILDDLTPLHQLDEDVALADLHLFAPRDAVRFAGSSRPGKPTADEGQNPPDGAILTYTLSESVVARLEGREGEDRPESEIAEEGEEPGSDVKAYGMRPDSGDTVLEIEILDAEGRVIRSFSSREEEDDPFDPAPGPVELGFQAPERLPAKAGMNRFVWDLRRDQVGRMAELAVLYPRAKSYRVAPGTYRAVLTFGEHRVERNLEVVVDPRVPLPAAAFASQQELIATIWQRVDGIHRAVDRMREVRRQVDELVARTAHLEAAATFAAAGEQLVERIDAWEEQLVQPHHETFQDVINFPNRLNAQYLFLLEAVDTSDPPVTAGARQRFADLEAAWEEQEAEMRQILDLHVPAFNILFEENRVPAVIVPAEPPPPTAAPGAPRGRATGRR